MTAAHGARGGAALPARLMIEPLAASHASGWFAGLSDPRLYRYIPDDPPASPAALIARFAQLAAGSRRPGEIWRNWVMSLASSGRPVGILQASVYADRHATIAYLVLPEHQGQGLAAEGVRWMLRHLAEQDQVWLAEAFIDTRNQASLGLVRRLGFRYRITLADADVFKGHASHEHVYEKQLVVI